MKNWFKRLKKWSFINMFAIINYRNDRSMTYYITLTPQVH